MYIALVLYLIYSAMLSISISGQADTSEAKILLAFALLCIRLIAFLAEECIDLAIHNDLLLLLCYGNQQAGR